MASSSWGLSCLALVKPCDRCVVTTVDQQDGRKTGNEPLATLKRIRRNPATGGAWFGKTRRHGSGPSWNRRCG